MGYWFTKLETVNQYFPFSLLSICGTLQCTYLRCDHSKAFQPSVELIFYNVKASLPCLTLL